ncbi:beta strand repeat-containing protein [Taibaiella soli]|uniref:Ig-like domain-containing protein n=1 Tax=Taibaiella soli TaxID=1649169 RepID=A0A2W2B2S5_9BACT|nr:T9SS type A sorting domain-containing protein [Taibaiella soli]PZF74584.1 hypothetical protein DN068_03130 [Taibaiella soli]
MSYRLRLCALLMAMTLPGMRSLAQLSGTITVPSSSYPDLASVVSALNTQGTAGNVTVNILPGNPQTAPAGGYQLGSTLLNATVSPTKPLIINGKGNTVTAFTGTGTTDGIFKILGTDNLTIDSLNLSESASNTTATTAMEWGYALLKLNSIAPYDGCQHVTISHSTISLGTIATEVTGIYGNTHVSSSTTALAAASAVTGDANSYNNFYGNTISNCHRGISMTGFNAAGVYDYNNVYGTTAGNTVTFTGTSTNGYGIAVKYDSLVNISNNTIGTAATNADNAYAIYLSTGKGNATVTGNIITNMQSAGTTQTLAGIYNAGHADNTVGATLQVSNNTLSNWSYATMTTGNMYGIYHAASLAMDTINFVKNTVSNLSGGSGVSASLGGFPPVTAAYDMIYVTSGATPNINIKYNSVTGIALSNTNVQTFCIYANGSGLGNTYIQNNYVNNITTGGSMYGVYGSAATTRMVYITGNRIQNMTSNATSQSAGQIYGINGQSGGANSIIANDTISNTSSIATCYGIGAAFVVSLVHDNIISNMTNTGITNLYGVNISGGTGQVYNNRIYGLNMTGTSGGAYGISMSSNTDTGLAYNNNISGFTVSAGFSTSGTGVAPALYGIDASGGGKYRIYHNTVDIATTTTTGANFSAAGVYYSSSSIYFDLRNNILNINCPPVGAGYTTALRRNNGTTGTVPANLYAGSGGNIYYVPNTSPKCLYYGEGITAAGMANLFGPANDPNFNTSCGAYKTFMGKDLTSYTENNLVAGSVPGTFVPAGSSYAKSGGIPTNFPPTATDYAGTTRPVNTPDAGALQFTGTAVDIAPPVITYTALPAVVYCTTPPVLSANITDVTGVNVAAGTAPRLYYKKASENNAFGSYPLDNSTSFNGWKYVEATGTAPNFSFTINYNKLASAPAVNDSISYFVVAQDVTAAIQVGVSHVGFAPGYCPSSVNLTPAAGPLSATPVASGYRIVAPVAYTATASQTLFCTGGTTNLSITPVPTGLTVQWQEDNGGGYNNIFGATTANYTATVNATANYQAVLSCSGTPVATSTAITASVTNPTVASTAPASRCGFGTVTLGATGSTGTTINWYNAAIGGTLLATGNSYTTPTIGASTTYYVAASSNIAETTPAPPANNSGFGFYTATVGWGLVFAVNNPATINSVKMYPYATTSGPATLQIVITDMSNNVVATGPVYNFTAPTTAVAQTVPVGISLTPGNYKMAMTATGITKLYNEYNAVFPYTTASNSVSITAGATGGTTTTSEYYWFYNWSVTPGCISARTPVVATVTPAPAIALHASSAPDLCAGSNDTLTVTSANSGYTYSWAPVSATGSTLITSPATDTVYHVTATDNTSGCVAIDSVAIHIAPVPQAIINSTGSSVCQGDSLTLNALFGVGYTYQWMFNSNTIAGQTAQTYAVHNAGAYTVKVTQGVCSAVSTPVNVTVSPLPTPTVTDNGTQLQTGTFTTYQWNLNGNAISGATGQNYTPTQAGSYTVTVTNSNGCEAESAPYNYNVGIPGISGPTAVSVYPNPAEDRVHITAAFKVNVTVTDLQGKALIQQNNAVDIDLKNLPGGVYLMQIRNGDNIMVKIEKLIKR